MTVVSSSPLFFVFFLCCYCSLFVSFFFLSIFLCLFPFFSFGFLIWLSLLTPFIYLMWSLPHYYQQPVRILLYGECYKNPFLFFFFSFGVCMCIKVMLFDFTNISEGAYGSRTHFIFYHYFLICC